MGAQKTWDNTSGKCCLVFFEVECHLSVSVYNKPVECTDRNFGEC